MAHHHRPILLTGATGYVGGRLLRALEDAGRRVRCLVLDSRSLSSCVSPTTEIVQGDVRDLDLLRAVMQGVDTAYYLVYTAAARGPLEDDTRRSAATFAAAARQASVRRIIHLGGLNSGGKYSGHLCGAQEVGDILRESGAQVIDFRTSVIVGSGSLAFELVRALAEQLPVVVAPRWARTLTRPIAIEDVVAYLVAALETGIEGNAVFEIGGADRASFTDLLKELARQRGRKRWVIPLPVLMPRFSILCMSLIAPVYARVSQELVATLCARRFPDDLRALEVFPVQPRGIREAIERALTNEGRPTALTHWFDALGLRSATPDCRDVRLGPRIVDSRSLNVPYPAALAFQPIERIGGKTGWYYGNWMWRLRSLMDRVVGGVGANRGRRDPDRLSVGDPVDFWRVEAIDRGRLLRLAAEMKLPGRAWLQFEIEENSHGSKIRQTAIFDPLGIPGLLYWLVLSPSHGLIFNGMLRGIARAIPKLRDTPPRR